MQNSQKNQSNNTYKFPDIDLNNISTGWINKLNKEKLITELSRRKKWEFTPDNFEKSVQDITFISEPITNSVDNITKNNMTDNKKTILQTHKLFSGEDIKWPELEKKLRLEFEPTAQTDMLRLMLEKRKQLPDEPTVSYINEAKSLCRRIDNKMSQDEMVHNIMKGLNLQ
ncbi:jerky protein-like [Aphis craccivora]|uniref:Jerky protein-like n=1 Tax=Aphis craccivora TaxID=307492 RepID=A0A6G0VQ45_APHCR|nr:jerky protein-like [Aphis craccivora]